MSQPLPQEAWDAVTRSDSNVPEVDVAWVKRWKDHTRVIDVREAHEFEGELGRLDFIEHVPLGTVDAASNDWDDKDAPLVVICRSGGRSGRAALLLEDKGFSNVVSMAGGMIDWRRREAAGE